MDIVYILKKDIQSDELRYSLRSLKNFPHDKVWFFGGIPEDLKPDRAVYVEQRGTTTWAKVRNTIELVCRTREVSDDFWLFNDDFFVMKPVDEWTPKYDRTLYRRVEQIKSRHNGAGSLYTAQLEITREIF